MHIFSRALASKADACDGCRRGEELAGARDQDHAADKPRKRVATAEHLDRQLRQAVAEGVERHALEHDVGETSISGCIGAFARDDEAVGRLRFGAGIETERDGRQVEFAAVGPDAPDAGDLALGKADGKVREIAVLGLRDAAAAAALAATAGIGGYDLFFEVGRPDQLASKARASVDARDRRAFCR